MKAAFGASWKEVLCGKQVLEGKVDPGSPVLLVVSSSALRAIELLRFLSLFNFFELIVIVYILPLPHL